VVVAAAVHHCPNSTIFIQFYSFLISFGSAARTNAAVHYRRLTVEVEYTRGLLHELSGSKYIPMATPVYNKTGKRTRHINLRFHRVREAVAKDSIDVKRVTGGNDPATSEMVADILTKSTPAPLFVVMASIMSGMHRK